MDHLLASRVGIAPRNAREKHAFHSACVALLDGLLSWQPDAPRDSAREAPSPQALPADSTRLADAFLAIAQERANHPLVIRREGCCRYRDVAAAAMRVASHLRRQGLVAGARVVLMLNNSAEYVAAFYGALLAGGVVVPLPPTIESARFERVAALCEPSHVLTTADLAARRGELGLSRGESIAHHMCGGDGSGMGIPSHSGDEFPSHKCDSLAVILFTAGSSGEPKGVMLSDRNLLANARSILAYLPITPSDRTLALLPFYHAYGNSVLQTHVLRGATLVMDGSAAFPITVTEALRAHRITSLAGVPEVFHGLLALSDLAKAPFPDLRYMTVAGGALAPASVREVARRIAPAEFYVMYGQTEATARLAYLPPEHVLESPGSIGRAIPEVSLRIVDEQGVEVPCGEVGELQARGPNITLGYWRDAAGTAAALADGWLRTGDLAARDERGFYHIRGRGNDLLKVQGLRIHPAEIEAVVAERWPDCRSVAVAYQQAEATRLALFVAPGAAAPPTVEELRQHCLRELPRPKVPTHLEILPELPLNAALKVDRAALVRRAQISHCA